MSNNSITPYLTTGTFIGGLAGIGYGLKNPSEKSLDKIQKLRPRVYETMQDYRASFNLNKAKEAVLNQNLDLNSYTKVKNIADIFVDVAKKEKNIEKVLNTPYAERTISLKQAIKEANSLRPKMYKTLMSLDVELQNKLEKLKIFNKKKFVETTKFAKVKTIAMWKELSKGMIKFGAMGVAIGALIGAGLYKIANK